MSLFVVNFQFEKLIKLFSTDLARFPSSRNIIVCFRVEEAWNRAGANIATICLVIDEKVLSQEFLKNIYVNFAVNILKIFFIPFHTSDI